MKDFEQFAFRLSFIMGAALTLDFDLKIVCPLDVENYIFSFLQFGLLSRFPILNSDSGLVCNDDADDGEAFFVFFSILSAFGHLGSTGSNVVPTAKLVDFCNLTK